MNNATATAAADLAEMLAGFRNQAATIAAIYEGFGHIVAGVDSPTLTVGNKRAADGEGFSFDFSVLPQIFTPAQAARIVAHWNARVGAEHAVKAMTVAAWKAARLAELAEVIATVEAIA